MTSTVIVDYKDPTGNLKILLESTLVAVDFPYNICSALSHPRWKAAMCEELEALHKNKTWELIPRTRDLHVIGS